MFIDTLLPLLFSPVGLAVFSALSSWFVYVTWTSVAARNIWLKQLSENTKRISLNETKCNDQINKLDSNITNNILRLEQRYDDKLNPLEHRLDKLEVKTDDIALRLDAKMELLISNVSLMLKTITIIQNDTQKEREQITEMVNMLYSKVESLLINDRLYHKLMEKSTNKEE